MFPIENMAIRTAHSNIWKKITYYRINITDTENRQKVPVR